MKNPLDRKDWTFGAVIGLLIGIFFLPILKTAFPDLFPVLSYAVIPFFFLGALAGLFVSRLIGTKIPVIWQIAKFGLIGVLNSFIDLGVLSGLSLIGRSALSVDGADSIILIGAFALTYYMVFKTISFVVSNANSYFWNKHWTFESAKKKMDHAGFLQFFAVSLIGLFVNVAVSATVYQLGVTTTSLTSGQWGLLSGLAGIFAGLAWNFIGYKFVVFKD
ncbi:MAG: GtrA family protein [Candidatus Moranbacteria bacterium]|nr:GtrA family protein [Candidatus Moranbacteria bacterium]NTW45622.1 GtrA family protein [Candidatus Moranbacteria bacterium]